MSGTYVVAVGDRGRLVLPAELRRRMGVESGSSLVAVESAGGVVLLTREQLKDRVRADLAGTDLVSELLEERRVASADEDAALAESP